MITRYIRCLPSGSPVIPRQLQWERFLFAPSLAAEKKRGFQGRAGFPPAEVQEQVTQPKGALAPSGVATHSLSHSTSMLGGIARYVPSRAVATLPFWPIHDDSHNKDSQRQNKLAVRARE